MSESEEEKKERTRQHGHGQSLIKGGHPVSSHACLNFGLCSRPFFYLLHRSEKGSLGAGRMADRQGAKGRVVFLEG